MSVFVHAAFFLYPFNQNLLGEAFWNFVLYVFLSVTII